MLKAFFEKNKSSLFTLGAGLGIGALLGVLYAPDKGDKTRKRLVDQGNAWADQAKESTDELMSKINQQFSNGKDEVAELKDQVRRLARKVEKEMSANS